MSSQLTEQELANAVNVDGLFVDRDVLGVVERIQDHFPELRVQYLEAATSLGEAPWRIVERCKDGVDRVVMSVWQLDHSVFDRLVMHDTMNVDVLAELDKKNKAVKKAQEDSWSENLEDSTKKTHAILSTPKDSYSVRNPDGELITFRSNGTVKRG